MPYPSHHTQSGADHPHHTDTSSENSSQSRGSHHSSNRYHRKHRTQACFFFSRDGYCKRGDKCNFAHHLPAGAHKHHHGAQHSFRSHHSNTPSESSTSSLSTNSNHVQFKSLCPSLNSVKANFSRISLTLLSTRPLLHIVVLYGGNVSVRRYVAEVLPKFLDSRIHCFVQMNTPVSETNDSAIIDELSMEELRNSKFSVIKKDHLSTIISRSTADYLVVIGDRDMVDKTCHSKRNNSLIPENIDDVVKRIAKEWQQRKIRNPLDNLRKTENPKKDDYLKIFQWIMSTRNIKSKAKELNSEIRSLLDWYSDIEGDPEAVLLMNKDRLMELTKLQNNAIRLHKEVFSAKQVINTIPVDDEHPVDQARGLDLSFISQFNNYQIGISDELRENLLVVAEAVLKKIEGMCKDFSKFPNNGPLWTEYYKEYLNTNPEKENQVNNNQMYEKPQLRLWSGPDRSDRRSRSSSNVSSTRGESQDRSDTRRHTEPNPASNPIPTPNVQQRQRALSQTESQHSGWPSSLSSNPPAQPSSYSGAVISSLSSTPTSTHAELGDQSSIQTDDVSSILSSKTASSVDTFHTREPHSIFDPHNTMTSSQPFNLSNQMGNLNLYNTQPSANSSSFSSPSGSPPFSSEHPWGQNPSSHNYDQSAQQSIFSVQNQNRDGGSSKGPSFLPPNLWTNSNQGHSVSRFAEPSSSSNQDAPGLFGSSEFDSIMDKGNQQKSSSNSSLMQLPFSSGGQTQQQPSSSGLQAPQLLQGSSQQSGPSLMGNWRAPSLTQSQGSKQASGFGSAENERSDSWDYWNNQNAAPHSRGSYNTPFSPKK